MNKKTGKKKSKIENKRVNTPKKKNIREIDKKENSIKNKKVNKTRIGFVIAIIAGIIMYAMYLIINLIKNPTNTFMVAKGELMQEETVIGYIVREESIVKGENYKNGMVKIKNEGERVAKGDSISRYYSSGEEDLKEKIANINIEIQQIMQNEKGAFPSDIKLLESQIQSELNYIYKVNSMQKIQEYKKNINTYISKKAKITGEFSPAGSYLKQLLNQKEEYEDKLNSGSEYINAPTSGIVSYRVDGLEEVLKTDNFADLNKDFLDKLNIKIGQTVAGSEEMGKVVNNYESYIIFNSDSEEAKSAKVGDKLKIRLQNSNIVKAEIENIINEKDKTRTITIKITNSVEELIPYRKISFDIIWWSTEGYRIPNSAIKEENGLDYVVRNRNGYYNKMLVKILKKNDEYCIVKPYNTEELKELGFSTTQIYNMRNIALYDEIVLNPTDKQMLQ